MMDTELYVVKGKVFQQKKGFSAEIGDNIGYDKAAKMVKNYCDQQKENVTAHLLYIAIAFLYILCLNRYIR